MKNILIDTEQRGLRGDVIATELGHLWAYLLQRGALANYRSIGFCAIGDDEGSNHVAANLALYVGARGLRVVLVEATLRSPELAGMFELTETPGLAELLADRATLADTVRPRVAPGVDVVPAGGTTDAFWGFTNDRFAAAVTDPLRDRDVCFVDVPGINRAPEAALVVRSVDALVLVVEANRHDADVVRRNITWLRSLGTPFLGAVLTDVVYDLPAAIARLT
jgi:tyrosine-protein kinase Etk/Wzc